MGVLGPYQHWKQDWSFQEGTWRVEIVVARQRFVSEVEFRHERGAWAAARRIASDLGLERPQRGRGETGAAPGGPAPSAPAAPGPSPSLGHELVIDGMYWPTGEGG